jgi:membrane-bound serine protease (ClpP class)
MGFSGFLVLAWLLSRFLPKTRFMSGLVLSPSSPSGAGPQISMTAPGQSSAPVQIGARGEVMSRLRPAGKARFGDALVDVVATGEFLDKGAQVEIIAINGSRVVVKKIGQGGEA